jgi:hypothetical protein
MTKKKQSNLKATLNVRIYKTTHKSLSTLSEVTGIPIVRLIDDSVKFNMEENWPMKK